MKKLYRFYTLCLLLLLCVSLFCVQAFAVEDMWTAANRIIVDVYSKIAGVSTVLAGLMSAVAVVGAKLSNNQHKSIRRGTGCAASGSRGRSSTASARSLPMLPRCFRALQRSKAKQNHPVEKEVRAACWNCSFRALSNGSMA